MGITDLRFNQLQDCFIISSNDGIKVFNLEPLHELLNLTVDQVGSVSFAEMIFRTNLTAFVSGDPKPKYAENIVAVWDDVRKMVIFEFHLNLPVFQIRSTHSRLLIQCQNQIHIYQFDINPPVHLQTIDTCDNFRGLLALYCPIKESYFCDLSSNHHPKDEKTPKGNQHGQNNNQLHLIAFPGIKCGTVQIVDIDSQPSEKNYPSTIIRAHESQLWCLAFDKTGKYLATASKKGTLIRIFSLHTMLINNSTCVSNNYSDDAKNNSKLKYPSEFAPHVHQPQKQHMKKGYSAFLIAEFRRGTDCALFYSMNFSFDSKYLCCVSDKGTVHIFSLQHLSLGTARHKNYNSINNKMHQNKSKNIQSGETLNQFNHSYGNTSICSFQMSPDKFCICTFACEPLLSHESPNNVPHYIYALNIEGLAQKYSFNDGGKTQHRTTPVIENENKNTQKSISLFSNNNSPCCTCHRESFENFLQLSHEL